jgi:hypothetical protein
MKLASKSKKRIELLDSIQSGITTRDIFETIDYKSQSEDKIKQFIYPHLLNQLTEYVMEKKGFSRNLAKEKARTMIKWEGNVKTTVKNIQFMGTANRPDMTVEADGVKIAIEFKKGDRGSALREGFGQSVIYSTVFDFVIYMFIDTSNDGRIANGSTAITEQNFLDNLWNNFNVKFTVV